MKTIKNTTISVICANGTAYDYNVNGEYIQYKEREIAKMFGLEPLGFANVLEDTNLTTTFNTYNWNAPFTFDGVHCEDVYDGVALVNIHLGGDVRGNYSNVYVCEEVDALLLQNSDLTIEFTDGSTLGFCCENGEAYFDIDFLDLYINNVGRQLTDKEHQALLDLSEY